MKNDKNNDDKIESSRRNFLKYLLGGSLTAFAFTIIYPILKYLKPPPSGEANPSSVFAGKVGELEINSGKIFRFGSIPGIMINTPSGELKAFTAVCTHLDCTVQYRGDLEHIWCACHDGHYDLNGINIKGPPPRPLTQFKVNVTNDKIYVSKNT